MPSSRVIRPAKVLPEGFQVLLPDIGSRRGSSRGTEDRELSDAERLQQLEGALEAFQKRWEEREAEHASEMQSADERAAERVREAVDRFTSVVTDFVAQREDLLKSAEGTVIRLAVAVARKIVGEAIEANEEIVLEAVRKALKHVVEKEMVQIRVHPEDLKIVREHRSDWLSIVEGTRSLEIEEDDRIRRGGCLVETEAGNVEAQVDKQIQLLEKVLMERAR